MVFVKTEEVNAQVFCEFVALICNTDNDTTSFFLVGNWASRATANVVLQLNKSAVVCFVWYNGQNWSLFSRRSGDSNVFCIGDRRKVLVNNCLYQQKH